MLNTKRLLAVAALVPWVTFALVGCGQQGAPADPGESNQASAADSAGAEGQCDKIVDGEIYTEVYVERTVDGATFRDWLKIRSSGVYSPSQIEAVPADAEITVCALAAPGINHDLPPLSGVSSDPTSGEPTAAIVLLDSGGGPPQLDASGPKSSVLRLMDSLGG